MDSLHSKFSLTFSSISPTGLVRLHTGTCRFTVVLGFCLLNKTSFVLKVPLGFSLQRKLYPSLSQTQTGNVHRLHYTGSCLSLSSPIFLSGGPRHKSLRWTSTTVTVFTILTFFNASSKVGLIANQILCVGRCRASRRSVCVQIRTGV